MGMMDDWPYGYGYCCCGCGERTGISERDDSRWGYVRGEPFRYVLNHRDAISQEALPEVFLARVDRSDLDGCWPYAGAVGQNGYGRIKVRGRELLSHRVAYALAYGEIPDGLVVRHLCNNKICCRPDHLALGTHQDNMDDRDGAERQARGEGHGMVLLSEEQVLEIYDRYIPRVVTYEMLGQEYGVSKEAAFDIVNGRSWAWLTGGRKKSDVCA
jgi:hypothetical protein